MESPKSHKAFVIIITEKLFSKIIILIEGA